MSDKSFFKPTNLYKEYMILDLIEKNKDITQRELSSRLGVSVSMVNLLLDSIEQEGFVIRKKYNSKTVEYILTKKGTDRKKNLNIRYLSSAQKLYNDAKDNIVKFLLNQIDNHVKRLILYGAGDVSNIIIETILSNNLEIEIPCIIDDDPFKQNHDLLGVPICNVEALKSTSYDAVMVSSYAHHEIIYNKLTKLVNKSNIISYFKPYSKS